MELTTSFDGNQGKEVSEVADMLPYLYGSHFLSRWGDKYASPPHKKPKYKKWENFVREVTLKTVVKSAKLYAHNWYFFMR